MTDKTTVRLKTPAIIGETTHPAGWEGEVDAALATRMRDDGVAEAEAVAEPVDPAPDAA